MDRAEKVVMVATAAAPTMEPLMLVVSVALVATAAMEAVGKYVLC